jgi:uncharacterized protein YndB with AHSA1/START domain
MLLARPVVAVEKEAEEASEQRQEKEQLHMNNSHDLTSANEVQRPQFSRQMRIYIEAAPETVFRYVTDIGRHVEWSAQTLSIKPDPEHGSGATFASTALVGFLLPVAGHISVIAEEAPIRFVYEYQDLSGYYRWTMLLQPEGKGTRLTQRMERLQGPFWIRLAQRGLVWPLYGRRAVGKGLANIKAHLEAMQVESLTN